MFNDDIQFSVLIWVAWTLLWMHFLCKVFISFVFEVFFLLYDKKVYGGNSRNFIDDEND